MIKGEGIARKKQFTKDIKRDKKRLRSVDLLRAHLAIKEASITLCCFILSVISSTGGCDALFAKAALECKTYVMEICEIRIFPVPRSMSTIAMQCNVNKYMQLAKNIPTDVNVAYGNIISFCTVTSALVLLLLANQIKKKLPKVNRVLAKRLHEDEELEANKKDTDAAVAVD
ncbi:hypothetical protein L1887_14386 [Cichorium endivia]|nr:hypothetical protein L1887_14386 [Cichorium endivia]